MLFKSSSLTVNSASRISTRIKMRSLTLVCILIIFLVTMESPTPTESALMTVRIPAKQDPILAQFKERPKHLLRLFAQWIKEIKEANRWEAKVENEEENQTLEKEHLLRLMRIRLK